ncbi:class I SAM-dependent methyltransferase [Sphingomonas sp. AOB5]|uniref:class I SAM-dependent methyltransferase n=1 Tax=Sphingomonas sp. AOB5 TaxID=3034017 RepID=UPI0023F9B056|nr:class I SAM-dependent methyltransferase [Sphingomonas sp. AOB5]MDF7774412.1 class I SAM-dependent methyltransferase [Sphingomonas sp. AOB5]
MQQITTCEVCDGKELIPVLNLGDQPMCDDLVPIGSDAQPTPYPLDLAACPVCLTVHQVVQVEKKLLFPQTYHYRAAMTKDVIAGMRELVEAVDATVGGLKGKTVLDIGCNDGSLLNIFREFGASTVGIEPTGASEDARARVDRVIHGFFDSDAVTEYLKESPKPDVITFTNVFAHIEDLNGVIENLGRLLKPDSKLVVENHYLGAVIDRNQFDTFYHEHPRTYSCRSFDFIAAKLGLQVETVAFPPRYNGNIRVMMGTGTAGSDARPDESGYLDALKEMGPKVDAARVEIREKIAALVAAHGPLPGKAFPGRAAILVHCFGLDETMIDRTYERSGSPKIGNYIPGTRIEIRDEKEFFDEHLDAPVIVNFAWHIHAEIEKYMRDNGYKGQVVPIFE